VCIREAYAHSVKTVRASVKPGREFQLRETYVEDELVPFVGTKSLQSIVMTADAIDRDSNVSA
jgi:hypothetical protein